MKDGVPALICLLPCVHVDLHSLGSRVEPGLAVRHPEEQHRQDKPYWYTHILPKQDSLLKPVLRLPGRYAQHS